MISLVSVHHDLNRTEETLNPAVWTVWEAQADRNRESLIAQRIADQKAAEQAEADRRAEIKRHSS